MKTLEDYMKLAYKLELIEDPEEGGYVASYPDLPGCMTCGETAAAAAEAAVDAKKEWLTAALEEGYPIPTPVTDGAYSGQFKLRLPKSLHRLLAEHARSEGVSMNQYCVYLLSRMDGLYRT